MGTNDIGDSVRFDLACEALGFRRPPMPLHLRFFPPPLPDGSRWTVLVVVAAGKAEDAVAWMQSHAEGRATTPPGIAPRTVRFEVAALPPAWSRWLTAARVVQVDVGTHGVATLFVAGSLTQLAALAAALHPVPAAARQRVSTTKPIEQVEITPRQLEVLCNAVTMGYYDVPHRINLRELGKTMDLSVSAASQLLRRAQGQVIRAFIDSATLAGVQDQSDQADEKTRETLRTATKEA